MIRKAIKREIQKCRLWILTKTRPKPAYRVVMSKGSYYRIR